MVINKCLKLNFAKRAQMLVGLGLGLLFCFVFFLSTEIFTPLVYLPGMADEMMWYRHVAYINDIKIREMLQCNQKTTFSPSKSTWQ
jgi:hypothetical protein